MRFQIGDLFSFKDSSEHISLDFWIATSYMTPYNPRRYGQCERYNGIIWKITLLVWETVLLDVLPSIWSLLSMATNVSPHERFLCFQHCSAAGKAIPTWLTTPEPALLRRSMRQSKFEPLIDEVELIETNPHYAHTRYPNRQEDTV